MVATCGSERDLRPSVWISRRGAVATGADWEKAGIPQRISAGVRSDWRKKRDMNVVYRKRGEAAAAGRREKSRLRKRRAMLAWDRSCRAGAQRCRAPTRT